MISELAAALPASPAAVGVGPGGAPPAETTGKAFGKVLGQSLDETADAKAPDAAMDPPAHPPAKARPAMLRSAQGAPRARHAVPPAPNSPGSEPTRAGDREAARPDASQEAPCLADLLWSLTVPDVPPPAADASSDPSGRTLPDPPGDRVADSGATTTPNASTPDAAVLLGASAPTLAARWALPGPTGHTVPASETRVMAGPHDEAAASVRASRPSVTRELPDAVATRDAAGDATTPTPRAGHPVAAPVPMMPTPAAETPAPAVISPPAREILDALVQSFASRGSGSLAPGESRQDRTSTTRAQESLVATLASLNPGAPRDFRINPVIETVSVGTPVNHPDFPGTLAAEVGSLVFKGLEKAEILVTPPDLGPIRIELSLQGDAATVNFIAASEETRRAIEQSLPTLDGLLAQQGLQLSQSSVDAGAGRSAGGDTRDPAPGAAFASPPSGSENGLPSPSGSERAQHQRKGPRGLLDLFA